MQDKMKRLLDQIGMNTDYLEKASIKKIVVYDNNKLWNFIIENDKILPVYIYILNLLIRLRLILVLLKILNLVS